MEEEEEEGGREGEERRSDSRLLSAVPLALGLSWGSRSLLLHFGKVSPGSGLGSSGVPPGLSRLPLLTLPLQTPREVLLNAE